VKKSAFALTLVVCGGFSAASHGAGQPCKELAQLALPNVKITSAQTVAAGAFTPPAGLPQWMAGDPALYKQLPAFCRVIAQSRPSSDSDIQIEV